jgi:hypothetical protein
MNRSGSNTIAQLCQCWFSLLEPQWAASHLQSEAFKTERVLETPNMHTAAFAWMLDRIAPFLAIDQTELPDLRIGGLPGPTETIFAPYIGEQLATPSDSSSDPSVGPNAQDKNTDSNLYTRECIHFSVGGLEDADGHPWTKQLDPEGGHMWSSPQSQGKRRKEIPEWGFIPDDEESYECRLWQHGSIKGKDA